MAPPRITYTISMPRPHTHLFEVRMEISDLSGDAVECILPSWTPGSYMIREYARHVQRFNAQNSDGVELSWRKIAKDCWRIETRGNSRVVVQYEVYANDLTVRTSHLDASHGYFNPATVCMFLEDRMCEPLRVRVRVPAEWHVSTGLEAEAAASTLDGDMHVFSFLAKDYDELVDSPVESGTHRVLRFEVADIPHEIVLWGRGNEDEHRLIDDLRQIVETQRALLNGLPYRRYVFIVHLIAEGYGGLEHKNSMSVIYSKWQMASAKGYQSFLELMSHEFFHVWNVKRLRPAPLGPFDYRRENYTRALWVAEGFTSYYDALLLVRSGQMEPDYYLGKVASDIAKLQAQPGRHLQSLEQSSFDTWIKFYRPDENSDNSSISYYLKGGLVTMLLDLEVRRQTNNTRTIDDVLRLLVTTYPEDGPGFPEEGAILAAVEEVAGQADGTFRRMFERYIAGTDELDYASAFDSVGLRLDWSYRNGSQGDSAWLGLDLREQKGLLNVKSVRADGAAIQGGISAGDDLLAIDGHRVGSTERFQTLLEMRRPGETITVTLFRREEMMQLPVVLAAASPDKLTLRRVEAPTAAQEEAYRLWLGQA